MGRVTAYCDPEDYCPDCAWRDERIASLEQELEECKDIIENLRSMNAYYRIQLVDAGIYEDE